MTISLPAEMNLNYPQGSNLPNLGAYELTETENGFEFITDKGAVYEIYFGDGSLFFEGSSLAPLTQLFGFTRKKKVPKGVDPHDDRIKITIKQALYRAIEENSDMIVVFNCSTEGGKQMGRRLLFSSWFDEEDANLTKYDFEIRSNNRIIPSSVILKNTHPCNNQELITKAVYTYLDAKQRQADR